MPVSPWWIGLDVGERETRLCALESGREHCIEKVVPSTVQAISASVEGLRLGCIREVVLESGSPPALVRQLRQIGLPVTVLDAGKASKFLAIRQNKTDVNDARGLAEIARMGQSGALAVHVKSPETQLLRSSLVLRDQMIKQKGALSSALRSLLRVHGSSLTRLPSPTRIKAEISGELARLHSEFGIDLVEQVFPILQLYETFAGVLHAEDKRIGRLAAANPITSRLMQVPGVGPITALSFYTAIENPWRFPRATDVGAYLGLTPRVKQSGATSLRLRITKAGNKLTRGHLVMSANVILSRAATRCALADWGRSLAKRVGHSKAKVAVARKLAVLLLSLWRSGHDFQPYPSSCDR